MVNWIFSDAKTRLNCPKCKALTNEPCRTPKGKKSICPHSERVAELIKVYGIEPYQTIIKRIM